MDSPADWWAKSPRGDETEGESLVAHTLDVVRRVARLRDRAPYLSELCDDARLWHRLGLAAALHDLGKADPRFQRMLRQPRGTRSTYDQRHEVLSLAWLNWALGTDPHGDRTYVAAAIASHHKDYGEITTKYSLGCDWEPAPNIEDFLAPIPAELFAVVATYFVEEILPRVRAFGLLDDTWTLAPWPVERNGRELAVQSLRENLAAWQLWMDDLEDPKVDPGQRRFGLILRGVMLLADHAGSAHEEFRSLEVLHEPADMGTRLAPPTPASFYPHQSTAAETCGHALLVAPTGSGKTEAALLWASRQYANGRGFPPLFYVLPFKASMNAMQRRLVGNFAANPQSPTTAEEAAVMLQHSSALQVLYHQLMNRDDAGQHAPSPKQAEWVARRQQNLAKLHTAPVRVLSPYQLLRAAYQLKGHEAIWADAAGGLFIFDEIHAYEAKRLAAILEQLRFLVHELGAKVFVMTATMPRPIRDRIQQLLGRATVIQAQAETYAKFRRHTLRLSETGLLEDPTVDQIVTRIQGREAVLCVATTVGRAQQLQRLLRERLRGSHEVKLLHGRFNGRDRNALETEVRQAVATQNTGADRRPIALVATQVVEVSLDVDFDVLFTDPAPLEALLQRFGRVNRSRRPEPKDVVVCTSVDDSQPVYDEALVHAAIGQLQTARDQVIDEALVQTWLDTIYSGPIGDRLSREITDWSEIFRRDVLSALKPFDTEADLEEMFLKQFDGAEVLPRSLCDEYRLWLEEEPLKASMLTVPVSQQQLVTLRRRGLVQTAEALGLPTKHLSVVDVPYSSESGLELNPPRHEDDT
jgi:CRISPR-associated endonuclease/helicase Cas3